MKTLVKRIEVAANLAIIAVALLIGAVAIDRYRLTDQNLKPEPQILAGAKVALPNVDWTKSGQTLLLVLQKGCRFCSESAPFYQRLVRATAASGGGRTQLIAVLPQDVSEGREYLSDLEVPIAEVKQAAPGALGASGTPTLILVNQAGAVTASWVGKLPPAKELEVLNQLEAERASN